MRVFRNPGHTISSFLAPIPQKPNNTDWRRNDPKNQKVLQTCENQLYQGKHSIFQTSEIPKVLQTSEKQLFQGKHPICQTSEKPKSAAKKRKPA